MYACTCSYTVLFIPGHEIRSKDEIVAGSLSEATAGLDENGEAEAEEDEIVSSVCVPSQAALESADLLLRFVEQQDDISYTDILHLQKIKLNINKKLNAAKVQKKMTSFFKKNISPPLVPIFSKGYPISRITTHLPQIHFNVILPSMSRPP